MIDFNIPPFTGKELEYMKIAVADKKICGDGQFTKKCQAWMNERFGVPATYLTTSGTTALEMAALLSNIEPGDEAPPTHSAPQRTLSYRGAQSWSSSTSDRIP